MKLFLGVTEMAKHLQVSRTRVKVLLRQGRLKGWINPDTGRYEIPYPPTITHGTRGPQLGRNKGTPHAARNRATRDDEASS